MKYNSHMIKNSTRLDELLDSLVGEEVEIEVQGGPNPCIEKYTINDWDSVNRILLGRQMGGDFDGMIMRWQVHKDDRLTEGYEIGEKFVVKTHDGMTFFVKTLNQSESEGEVDSTSWFHQFNRQGF